jgi:hypothetical protein
MRRWMDGQMRAFLDGRTGGGVNERKNVFIDNG